MTWTVVKRDGHQEPIRYDAIRHRLERLSKGLNTRFVSVESVTQKVIAGVYDGVKTTDLDVLAAETAASLTSTHPDYGVLAARITASNLQKETPKSFSKAMELLYLCKDEKTGRATPLISEQTWQTVQKYKQRLDDAIDNQRDMQFSFFGLRTLIKSYLLRVNGLPVERPQYLYMRVAVGIHGDDIDRALQCYEDMSLGIYTHATPTMTQSGTPHNQLSSCFLLKMTEDSIEGIYDTLKRCACISKRAGGIGLAVHNIRATGSYIAGTNGNSNGLVPMLRVFSMTARYVDQGGNKRPGAFAIYIEPWHADIFEFLDLKKNTGVEELRARDLFYGLWIPDLFMRRVEADAQWTLMCPHECPGLNEVHSEEFDALYTKYESEGRGRRSVRAQELWSKILEAQTETGNPYMLYKDECNRKSNQKNLGTIQCSNLCTEIVEYTSNDECSVCNLASIALHKFVVKHADGSRRYDFEALHRIAEKVTLNLNRVIDVNQYPLEETRTSNLRHRPIGIGVQGLADAFVVMKMPFCSPEARQLNKDIFETIYHGALTASLALARADGPYASFAGSPASQGLLQFDLWGVDPGTARYDWPALKADIVSYGLRNSLLLAPMPTASTAQILGNNEAFEPYTSNIYTRRTLAGEFVVVNRHLLDDLIEAGVWDDRMRNELIAAKGSVQNIARVPAELKERYRTVWEMPQRALIDMAADRGPFICQSQSLNLFLAEPTHAKLTSMHFYAWRKGLKTSMYYLRSRPAADAIAFTVDKAALESNKEKDLAGVACALNNREACEACSA